MTRIAGLRSRRLSALAAVALLCICAPASEYTPLDKPAALEAVKKMSADAVAGGKKVEIWLTVFGTAQKVELAKASGKFLSVKVFGNVMDVAWEKIKPEELAGVAKSCVLDNGRNALATADYCIANNLVKLADDALTLAIVLDAKNLAPEVAARQKALKGEAPAPQPANKAAADVASKIDNAESTTAVKVPPPAPAMPPAPAAMSTEPQRGVYVAPDREPTPSETLMLEYLNRFRGDPAVEAERIAPPGKSGRGVDWQMFRDEMKALKAMPPLVFNLELLDAARKHSHYMILNNLTHVEEADKPGFVAAGFGERCGKAGYRGFAGGENCFRDPGDPWGCHEGFVVDFGGGGTGGMQAGRGHRANMIGGSREIGLGAVPHSGRLSTTHNFGTRKVRQAGGVVYIDINANKFYDIGEGLGGVAISCSDGREMRTWKSGAYTLELKSAQGVTLTAELSGEKFSQTFPASGENIKFDWAVPVELPLKVADKLLDAVDAAGDAGTPKHFQAVVALAMGAQGLYMDEPRRKRAEELTATVGAELSASQAAVLEALNNGDASKFSKTLNEMRKPYRGTAADAWFTDAELFVRLKQGAANFERQAALVKPSPKDRAQFVMMLEEAGKALTTPHFKQELNALAAKARM